MPKPVHCNLSLLNKLDIENLDSCADIFADEFVWHYFNPARPELAGDYQGVSGLKSFFGRLKERSHGAFKVKPVETRAVGEELVIVHARNRFASDSLEKGAIEFDAIVVWRIVDAKLAEAWDIPAVHSVRMVHSK